VSLLPTKLAPDARPVLYRYVTPQGQTRYTNVLGFVPAAQRSAAAVDLSRVSVNSDVGRDLDQRLQAEHGKLASGPSCQQLRAAAEKPLWRTVWDEHGPLVVIGGAICLLFLVTPMMLRRFGPNWARALSITISALAAIGLFTYATLRGSQALSQLKARAAPCEPGSYEAVAKTDHGLVERVRLLQGMRTEQLGLEQIAAESR
jgi:hypothetical protein